MSSLRRLSARIAELHHDPRACAEAAGLVYVSDDDPGIHRRRQGNGFSYRDPDGRLVTDADVKARIRALAVPPAWRNVWICPDEKGHLLAVGEDDRGRKQYVYHEQWRALRDRLNFYRLIAFGEVLPAVRRHVDAQLRRRTLDRDQVLAAMVRIVDASAVRIGNEVYAEENDSFGLTTLSRKHVTVDGGRVRMRFPAKSGQPADLIIDDRPVARVITKLEQHRRRRLFTVDGAAIDSADVNALLAGLTHDQVTAKDFRTWRASHAVFCHLEAHVGGDPEHTVLEAIDVAAEVLGNTRTVARAHYVHPHLTSSFADGTFESLLRKSARRRPGLLDGSEQRLLAFLKVALEADLEAGSI